MNVVIIVAIFILIIILIVTNIRIVQQSEAFIIERLGAYAGTWHVGLHIKVPFIDKIVNKFKNDKYFDSIRLYFFEGKTNEQIADHFIKKYKKESILPETIRTNKNRLVREMQTYFFPNDVISEILGY